MLIRYSSKEGEAERRAEVYQLSEHGIDRNKIDPDVLNIIRRLRAHGFQAYLVGGAIRDLLIGRKPKDFDVVTDAIPNRVKKIFRNSRVIGKRFRLVHVFFPGNKIVEVATFRSLDSESGKAVYGTIEEDVTRRDFTQNALFYSPQEQQIIDYVGGFRDIKNRRVEAIIPLEKIFREDPVRLIRAVKYAVTTESRLAPKLKRKIKSEAELLGAASSSRLIEELFKILGSGKAAGIFEEFISLGLLEPLVPNFTIISSLIAGKNLRKSLLHDLAVLDQQVENESVNRGQMLYYFLHALLEDSGVWLQDDEELYSMVLKSAKKLLLPLVASNRDVEGAVKRMAKEHHVRIPRSRYGSRSGRKKRYVNRKSLPRKKG